MRFLVSMCLHECFFWGGGGGGVKDVWASKLETCCKV